MTRVGILSNFPWKPIIPTLIGSLLLIGPILLTGQAVYWGTPYLQFAPWRFWAWNELMAGRFPLWNPLVGMGAPLAANYQSALFYPPNWFLFLLQSIGGLEAHAWGQGLLILFHWIWAGAGMALFVRHLGSSSFGQAVSSISFALSGYLVARAGFLSVNAAVAWLPWVLWGVEFLVKNGQKSRILQRSWLPWLPFTISLSFQLLAGHAQTTWYTLILASLWLIFKGVSTLGWKSIPRLMGIYSTLGLVSVAICSVQLIPTAEFLANSQRSSEVGIATALNFSFWPWRLITLIAPNFFGNPVSGDYWFNVYFYEDAIYLGLIPFILALIALVGWLFKEKGTTNEAQARYRSRVIFFTTITIVAFVLAMGRYTPIFPWFYRHIPSFDMFQAPARMTIWAVFSIGVLAGIGADRWNYLSGRSIYWTRLATAGALATMIAAGIAWLSLGEIQPTFIRAVAVAGFLGLGGGILALLRPRYESGKSLRFWKAIALAWITFDLVLAGWGLNPSAPIDLYTDTKKVGNQFVDEISDTRIYIPDEDLSFLMFEKFFRVNEYQPEGSLEELSQAFLPNTMLFTGIASANNFDPLITQRYAKWKEYLSTVSRDSLMSWLAWMNVSRLEVLTGDENDQVVFLPTQDPRPARWTTCSIRVATKEEAFVMLHRRLESSQPPSSEVHPVILEGTPSNLVGECNPDKPVSLHVNANQPGKVIVFVEGQTDGWVIIAQSWYPGWKVLVDGLPAKIEVADFLFQSVAVPAGRHEIVFQYDPVSYKIGAGISLLVLLTLFVFVARKERGKRIS